MIVPPGSFATVCIRAFLAAVSTSVLRSEPTIMPFGLPNCATELRSRLVKAWRSPALAPFGALSLLEYDVVVETRRITAGGDAACAGGGPAAATTTSASASTAGGAHRGTPQP